MAENTNPPEVDVPEPVTRVEKYWYEIVQNSGESLPDGDNLAY